LLLQQLAGLLAGFLYAIYASTYRYQIFFEDPSDAKKFYYDLEKREAHPENIIFACFHQDDLSLLPRFSKSGIYILISNSKDGQILASAVEHMGYRTVRGSSHRGAVGALFAIMKKVGEGHKVTIAVDGPRGPIYKVKDGITAAANKHKKKITPIRGFPHWKIVFRKSWNKATLPLPFTKIDIVVGKIADYDTQSLEAKLLSITSPS
jgi:lysophospholipid acyltransferase (LPLAT)-like uncharacterized protein